MVTKKSYFKKVQIFLSLSLFFLLLVISFFLLRFNLIISTDFDDVLMLNLDDQASEIQTYINTEIQEAKSDVYHFADTISTLGYEESNVLEFLQHQYNTHNFTDLFYIDSNGLGISVKNVKKDFSLMIQNHPLFDKVMTTNPIVNETTQEKLITIFSPIYSSNTIIGYILAEYSLHPISIYIKEQVDNQGYLLISDGNGQPIIRTHEEFSTLSRLSNSQLFEGRTVENIYYDISQRREGTVSFIDNDKKWIAIYKPLDVFNWYIVLVVEEEKISQRSNVISKSISVISLIIFLLLVATLWYTFHSKFQSIKKIETMAYFDELTGLPNMTKFKMHVLQTIKKYPHESFALIKIDIENFKTINEMYGYDIGNDVLGAFAKTAELATEQTFMLARVDADKFIMFSGGGFLEQLDSMTTYYEDFFKKAIPTLKNHHFEFSYGRYFIKPGETDINDMINKTTIAHSLAKKNRAQVSPNTICDYKDSYTEEILFQTLITNKMNLALENNEFILYLQTKTNINTGKVVGAEALVRWVEGNGNMVFPSLFIPLFEKNGFVKNLDMYILDKVCVAIKEWLSKGCQCVPVSINFSRLHLRNANFVNSVIKIVDSHNIPHNLIEIELTESTVIDNEAVLENLLNDFYSAGFLVSIDDFGAGYSSLGLLKNFKLHTIKLDRSFFLNDTSERAKLVIEGIINLAHSLGIKVVAEGIEEQRQIDFLKEVKCEVVQGYYYDKPIPIEIFTEKYL